MPQGSPVDVYVSKGPQKVPDVVGMQQSEAENDAARRRLRAGPGRRRRSDKPQGEVIQQIPGAGQPQNRRAPR